MANKGVNKVILIGNLGQDPEIRYMPNGSAVANITLATSESWKNKQTGEIKEQTEWHRVVLFGKLAEVAKEYLYKGSQIYIEGQLRTRKWIDQSGKDKYTTEVVVHIGGTMKMLGNRYNLHSSLPTGVSENHQQNSWNLSKNNKKFDIERPSSTHQEFTSTSSSSDELSNNFEDDIPF